MSMHVEWKWNDHFDMHKAFFLALAHQPFSSEFFEMSNFGVEATCKEIALISKVLLPLTDQKLNRSLYRLAGKKRIAV